MIESVTFRNFKVLRDTTLPLGPLTLIVGPNGSGKSTAIEGILAVAARVQCSSEDVRPAVPAGEPVSEVKVTLRWTTPDSVAVCSAVWNPRAQRRESQGRSIAGTEARDEVFQQLSRIRAYAFEASRLGAAAMLTPGIELQRDGTGLAAVLDRLRDEAPQRFEALNAELGRWLPEFDHITFETPSDGHRAIVLRTRQAQYPIRARNLSAGTLIALGLLTLAYIPHPPPVICLEEPDHGVHPRLLRDVRDALYRLAYPESCGEARAPVQVIATTHSPYLVDLFRDHLEEIVIANKVGTEATFERLSDRPDVEEIIGECALGDAWYSGILGGVPSER